MGRSVCKQGARRHALELVNRTCDEVAKHFPADVSVAPGIAQRLNPEIKIQDSIQVGKSRYWRGLASSANFPGKTMTECLDVIHTDIIAVWNFNDQHGYLNSRPCRDLMIGMVNDLVVRDRPDPNKTLTAGLAMVGTIAGIVSALSGPAAPIVVPIAAGVVIAVWAREVYKQSDPTLRRLMAYIVDLTLIMQTLFLLIPDNSTLISRRLVKFAFKVYDESLKDRVHTPIAKYVDGTNVTNRGDRDNALEKIEELIKLSCISSEEMLKLREQIVKLDAPDELWDSDTRVSAK